MVKRLNGSSGLIQPPSQRRAANPAKRFRGFSPQAADHATTRIARPPEGLPFSIGRFHHPARRRLSAVWRPAALRPGNRACISPLCSPGELRPSPYEAFAVIGRNRDITSIPSGTRTEACYQIRDRKPLTSALDPLRKRPISWPRHPPRTLYGAGGASCPIHRRDARFPRC